MHKHRCAIVATHPIQHFCPQYRSLSHHPSTKIRALFWSLRGVAAYQDPDFARVIRWDNDMLAGVDYSVVNASAAELRRQLDEFDPEWVIVYGYRSAPARVARLWAKRTRRRVAYISDTEERHDEPGWRRLVRRTLMRLIFPSVDCFLTVGDANEAFYRACGVPDRKLIRMHFPIDPKMFDARPDTAAIRSNLGVDEQALMVLNVGKLIPRKRQGDLIEATRHFTKRELHLVLVGSGPDEELLKDSTAHRDNVTLAGFVAPNHLPSIYSTSDVYAHVSDMDPHPLAVSEAAAGASALLVSDAVGSWGESDDVRPGYSGHVVSTGDIPGLESALRSFVNNRSTTRKMGLRARTYAQQHQRLAHGEFLPALLRSNEGSD